MTLGVSISLVPLKPNKYSIKFFILKLNSSGFSTKYSFPGLQFYVGRDKHLPIESVLLKFYDIRDENQTKVINLYVNAVRLDGFVVEFLFREDDRHYIGNKGPFSGEFDCETDQNDSPILLVKMKNFMIFSGASTDMQNICHKPGKVMSSSFSSNAVIFKCEGTDIYQDDVFPKTQCTDSVDTQEQTQTPAPSDTSTTNTTTNDPNQNTTTSDSGTNSTDPNGATDNTTASTGRLLENKPFSTNQYALLLSFPFLNMNYQSSQQLPKSMAESNDLGLFKEFNTEFNCNANCISCFRGQCFKCKLGFELVSLSFCRRFPNMIFNPVSREYENFPAEQPLFFKNSVLLPVYEDSFVDGHLILNFDLEFAKSFNFAPVKFHLQDRHLRTILSIPKVGSPITTESLK